MKSVIRPIRFPEDLDKALNTLTVQQEKTRSQIVRGSVLHSWADFMASALGGKRMAELVKEYHAKEGEDDA